MESRTASSRLAVSTKASETCDGSSASSPASRCTFSAPISSTFSHLVRPGPAGVVRISPGAQYAGLRQVMDGLEDEVAERCGFRNVGDHRAGGVPGIQGYIP